MSDTETPFDLAAEVAYVLGEDDEDEYYEPTPEPLPTNVELDNKSQTELDLINLAADAALVEAQAAKQHASEAKTAKALARLRERREELTALHSNPALDGEAAGAVSRRAEQLIVELDMGIETLEAAGPLAHLTDEKLGTFNLERMSDPSGVTLNRYIFTAATGAVGDAARRLEDAEHGFQRVLTERMPDLAAKDALSISDRANELRANLGNAPLRVRDALAKLDAAQTQVDGLAAEITRRQAEHQRTERIGAEALELATAKATAIDEQIRKDLVKSTKLSAEDKAVELGRLQVPMSERQGEKKQWAELLTDAQAQATGKSKETRIRQRLGAGLFLTNDPLLRFLVDGERMELSEFEDGNDGRRGFAARSPAEAEALRALGGVDGLAPKARGEAAIKTAQQGWQGRIEAAMTAQDVKQRKYLDALIPSEKR